MEEVLHRVRATRIEPGDLLVITLPGKVEPEAASALGKSLRAELNLAENRVLILQNGAQATTVSETLQTLHDLLDDAARSITALAGVVQHCQRHPDAVVAARDDRIVGYAVQTALMANDYVAHGTLPNREEASNDEEANAESG